MSTVEGLSITSDKHGYEFRYEGVVCVARVDTGKDDADYENFIRDLTSLDVKSPGWSISFPEEYRGQHGHYEDGARFLTTTRPDGRETTLEFTWVRCPWRLARGLELRYGKGKGQGKLAVAPNASQGNKRKGQGRRNGQRKGQGRSRRNPKVPES